MGLIKAAVGAVGGTLADQWKDFFSCEAIPEDVLVVKGQKQGSDRSSNKKGESNVISDGSGIVVADGQCMIIVEQGQVVELCAEPGVFTYDSKLTPSIFGGDLKEGLKGAAKDAWERFKFGGGVGKDQRIYYFNTKEILGNKYGTANPIQFKVVASETLGITRTVRIRLNGEFSYKIVNPMIFYTEVCGNIEEAYGRDRIDSQIKSELLYVLQPAFAKVSAKGVPSDQIIAYAPDIEEALDEQLAKKWTEKRGIQLHSFTINSVSMSDEDQAKIDKIQEAEIMSNERMAAGDIAASQASAMKMAAQNEAGAMTGFMGMGMASMAGGASAANLFAAAQNKEAQMAQQQQAMAAQQAAMAQQQAAAPQAPAASGWTCSCGATATGKFCPECGSPKPADADGWTCSCGAVNKGKFCQECGAKKPAGAPLYRCDKCGWEPDDPTNPPKFCPECGDIFDENDVK